MDKRIISQKDTVAADLPYSMAVASGSLLFVSGQVPVDPETNTLVCGTFAQESDLALQNLNRALEQAGCSMDNVLKTTVFLTSMENFAEFNEVYKRYFHEGRPARSCIEVSGLPYGARVEIEAIAAI